MQKRIDAVCRQYQLKACPAITVPGLSSAFICGVFRPVLVLPEGKETADFVLLHELLHLKYFDALQSIGWCILRALHWCNPFLAPVFRIIENDMESLCDQRVLERLLGEDRRLYGQLLLSMANDTYARAPGTSSISNGGKNIAKRITAIVRFKKYPKGMALVSVCVTLLLAGPSIVGSAAAYSSDEYTPRTDYELSHALSMARLNRCTTLAGALDTYAKGLLQGNGIYVAMASSLSKQENLCKDMQNNHDLGLNLDLHYYDPGEGLSEPYPGRGYQIYNITQIAENRYEALLVLPVIRYTDDNGDPLIYPNAAADDEGPLYYSDCYVIVPVTVCKEDAWVVEESGERILSTKSYADATYSPEFSDIPWMAETSAAGNTGTLTMMAKVLYYINNDLVQNTTYSFLGATTSFDMQPKPDAEFEHARVETYTLYDCTDNSTGAYPEFQAGMQTVALGTKEDIKNIDWNYFAEHQKEMLEREAEDLQIKYGDNIPEEAQTALLNFSSSSNQGYYLHSIGVEDDWDYKLADMNGRMIYSVDENTAVFPYGYAIRIFWDQKTAEDFTVVWDENGEVPLEVHLYVK